MSEFDIVFTPQFPVWVLSLVSLLILGVCVFGCFSQLRGAYLRLLAGALICLALFNPALLREERSPLPNIVALVIDETTSQKLDGRDEQTSKAVSLVREQIKAMDGFELKEIVATDQISQTTDISSSLFAARQKALQDVPQDQVAGTIFITDGQVHDVPEVKGEIPVKTPLHVLLTGKPDERDRRIALTNAPRYGVVGESLEIRFRVEETGFDTAAPVDVTISLDGKEFSVEQVIPGEETGFVFDIPHGGKNIIEFKARAESDEITEINNTVFTVVNGIRENLRVLLVSGEPHAGERTWRNLLKSDGSVDLVHFTILRPPEKQDGTPINELSLIAFPTRELFVQKIDEFDLIIFDRYSRRGVLPVLYFDNIAKYVEEGGAVLVAAGPEYADNTSIGFTPLNRVLPALSNGRVTESPFKPRISELGEKHPVTRDLDGWKEDDPNWSHWYRLVNVDNARGETVMQDENENPLLVLERKGEGRVALFLSDHVWLWSRGYEGGGPHVQLLRRLGHWLMKEPELDEERLQAQTEGKNLRITRQTIGENPGEAEVLTPSGETQSLALKLTEPGLWTAETEVNEIGLYQITNGEFTTLAQAGPANPRELAEVVSTPNLLLPIVKASKGTLTRIADEQMPSLVSVGENGTTNGRGLAGLLNRNASVLEGVNRIPLFAGLLGLALLLSGFVAMWYREGR